MALAPKENRKVGAYGAL